MPTRQQQRDVAFRLAVENADRAIAQVREFGREGEQAFRRLVAANTDAAPALDRGRRAVEQMGASVSRFSGTARGAFGNVAQQIQDVAVQFQAGTSAAIIFAQQGPQIAGAFGPTGAVVGAFAAVIAVAASTLFGFGRDAEKTTDILRKVIGSFDDAADAAGRYGEALVKATAEQRRFAQQVAETEAGQSLTAVSRSARAAAEELFTAERLEPELIRREGRAPGRGPERAAFEGRLGELVRASQAGLEGQIVSAVRAGDLESLRRIINDSGLNRTPSGAAMARTLLDQATAFVGERAVETGEAEARARLAPVIEAQREATTLRREGAFASLGAPSEETDRLIKQRERDAARLAQQAETERKRREAESQRDADRLAREAQARRERVDALKLENEQIRQLAEASEISDEALEETKQAIDAENQVRRTGIDLLTDEAKALIAATRAREQDEARIRSNTQARADQEREAERLKRETERDLKRQAEETERLLNRPFENFLSNVQTTTASVFQDIYSGGVKTFSDLFATASQLAVRFAAELSALAVFRPGLVFGGAGAAGAPTAAGGAAATAASLNPFGPLGFFGGGLGTLGSAFPSVFGNSPALASGAGFGAGGIPTGGPLAAFGGVSIGGLLASGGLGFAAGSALGPLLGLNQTGSGIGGGLGAALGFAFGGPLGALAGGTLGGVGGGLLGNLFSKKGDDNAQAQIDLATGRLTAVNTNSDPRNLSQTQAIGAELATLRQTLGALGASFDAFSIEVKAGNKSGFTLRTPGGAAGTQEFGSAEELQAAALRLLAGSARGGLSAAERQALERTDATDAAGFAEALRVARAFEELTGDITPLGREIRALGDAFNSQREAFAKLGFSTEALIAAQERGVAGIREQAAAQIGARYDPTINALQAARQQIAFQNTSPIGQFQLAREEFERIRRGAAAGNVEAIGQLPAVATAFSAVVRDVFGTSGRAGGFQERIDATLAANQNLLQVFKEREERALGATENQTRTIIELHRESIAEARSIKRLLEETLLRQKTGT